MKKTVRLIALAMVAIMLCLALAACGKTLSGKYSAEALGTGVTYEFKGSKVTITSKALGAEVYSVEAKYQIKDDKITITLDDGADEDAKDVSGTFDFKETDDGIKIGIIEYKKVD